MLAMRYETKTAILLRRDLLPRQIANVSALFKTTDDIANRAEVAAHPTEALDLVGRGLHADRRTIDKVTAGLKFLD